MVPDASQVSSPRKTWYNPALDPALQNEKMTPAMRAAVRDGTYDDGTEAQGGPLMVPDAGRPANLISSLCEDGLHRPALDIDGLRGHAQDGLLASLFGVHPVMIVWVPSTSNWHAYLPLRELTWPEYVYLLVDCDRYRILEPGYVSASINRGQTLLRPPHIRKH